jgi:YegS/Rv2252/BmrU family lipid kinase
MHVIINPAAGQDQPILNILNDVFNQFKIDWEVSITKKFGDATQMAKAAAASGVDLVVGYGGDGTQMEVANGVMGSDTPMAILPGGTGNAMAFELKIPRDLRQAAEMICQSDNLRKIDLGRIGDRYFMLRTYTGPQQEEVASRADKDKYGVMAYPVASLRVFKDLSKVKYQLTLDGKEIEDEGVMCFIFNAGAWGGKNLPEAAGISASDGLLDVLILNKSRSSIRAFASYELNVGRAKAHVHHWQAKEIKVESDSPQPVWIDGEDHGQTPFTAVVVPQVNSVVVPLQKKDEQKTSKRKKVKRKLKKWKKGKKG